jgi:hypothetical protein
MSLLFFKLPQNRGYEWSNIVGVTAEDMRGKKLTKGKELSSDDYYDPECAEESYVVANAEDFGWLRRVVRGSGGNTHTNTTTNNTTTNTVNTNPNPIPVLRESEKFHIIVSFVTFCWLSDPMGTLCHLYNEVLAPGGFMIVGGINLLLWMKKYDAKGQPIESSGEEALDTVTPEVGNLPVSGSLPVSPPVSPPYTSPLGSPYSRRSPSPPGSPSPPQSPWGRLEEDGVDSPCRRQKAWRKKILKDLAEMDRDKVYLFAWAE